MFGKLLRLARRAAGVGLRQLARDLDLSPTYVSRVEHGDVPPFRDEDTARIEHRLGLPRGSLKSVAPRVQDELRQLLRDLPESGDFLHCAMEEGLTAADFMALTAVLRQGGRQALRQLLAAFDEQPIQPNANVRPTRGYFLHGRLEANCIIEVAKGQQWSTIAGKLAAAAARQRTIRKETLTTRLQKRLQSGEDELQKDLVISHVVVDGGQSPLVLLAHSKRRLWFVILTDEEHRAESVALLGRTARLCSHDEIRSRLLHTVSTEEILATFDMTVSAVPPHKEESSRRSP